MRERSAGGAHSAQSAARLGDHIPCARPVPPPAATCFQCNPLCFGGQEHATGRRTAEGERGGEGYPAPCGRRRSCRGCGRRRRAAAARAPRPAPASTPQLRASRLGESESREQGRRERGRAGSGRGAPGRGGRIVPDGAWGGSAEAELGVGSVEGASPPRARPAGAARAGRRRARRESAWPCICSGRPRCHHPPQHTHWPKRRAGCHRPNGCGRRGWTDPMKKPESTVPWACLSQPSSACIRTMAICAAAATAAAAAAPQQAAVKLPPTVGG